MFKEIIIFFMSEFFFFFLLIILCLFVSFGSFLYLDYFQLVFKSLHSVFSKIKNYHDKVTSLIHSLLFSWFNSFVLLRFSCIYFLFTFDFIFRSESTYDAYLDQIIILSKSFRINVFLLLLLSWIVHQLFRKHYTSKLF